MADAELNRWPLVQKQKEINALNFKEINIFFHGMSFAIFSLNSVFPGTRAAKH
jgi:hypothetical protein